MAEWSDSSHTAAPLHVAVSSLTRRTSGRRPKHQLANVPPVHLSASRTETLGELVPSRCQLPANAAAEFGMPPGATQGYAATELLLAVTDPSGQRCRSYQSALHHVRDHDDRFVRQ